MKKLLTLLAAGMLLTMSLATIAGAQTMNAQTLNEKQKSLVAISAFTANGDLEKLRPALHQGLDAGLTVNEIKEVLIQLYAYTGFPRSLNGINTFMAVMDEREKSGKRDEVGKEATPMPTGFNRDQYGAETRAKIGGRPTIPPPSGYQLFAPAIDAFLKEHLFADIFYRDNLDWQSRELSTISALATIKGAEGQLRFHMGGAMNMGLTEGQMRDFVSVLEARVGKNEAANAGNILKAVLDSRVK